MNSGHPVDIAIILLYTNLIAYEGYFTRNLIMKIAYDH